MTQFVKGRWYGRSLKKPLCVLPYGIKVISQRRAKYIFCYIEAHRFFPNSKISKEGRQTVQRSRVIMSALVGRALKRNEHVHHENENQQDDRPSNLKLISAAGHNFHHKALTQHTAAAKKRISQSMKRHHERRRK